MHNSTLNKIRVDSIWSGYDEIYSLVYYSSFGGETTIQFYQRGGNKFALYSDTSDEKPKKRPNYRRPISDDEWKTVVRMVDEYDFWTEDYFRANTGYLDGYVVILKGLEKGKPYNDCSDYKITLRGNPKYDKLGTLCDNLYDFENWLYSHDTLNNVNRGVTEW